MEFDLNNNIINNTIHCNYDKTDFYKNQIEKTVANGGYIKIPYPSKSNTPNIYSDKLFNGEYVTKNIYIIKKIHKIKNIQFDGELVIEHKSLTNNETPLYSCFLLKTSTNTNATDIDTLISGTSDTSINMNSYSISEKKAIFYKTSNENVIIFPTPILVKSAFDEYKSQAILNLPENSNEYSVVNITSNLGNIEGFKEGVDNTIEEDKYVDVATYCQPIDEEDPAIAEKAEILIPSDGKVSINKAATSQLSTAMNFFGFFIMVIFVIVIVPTIYHFFIVKLVLDNKKANPPFTPQQMLDRLSAVDIVMGVMLFLFSFALVNNGIVYNLPGNTVVGFYVFIFFISSFILLQYKRMFDSENFLKPFNEVDQLNPANIASIKPDLGGFILGIFYNRSILTIALLTALIYVIIHFSIIVPNGLHKGNMSSILMYIPVYMAILSMYIAVYIRHVIPPQ